MSDRQQVAFHALYAEVLSERGLGGGSISPPGRGAATLSKLLYSLEHLDEDRSAIDINALVPKALPLNVSPPHLSLYQPNAPKRI